MEFHSDAKLDAPRSLSKHMNQLLKTKLHSKPAVLSTPRRRNYRRSLRQRLYQTTGAIGSRVYQTVVALMSRRSQHKWQRRLRYYYRRFVRLRGTPESIARGLAAGVFASMFPLFGLQIFLGIALATIVRGNKIMAAAGTWVSNPLTYVPIYAFNFKVGQWLLGSDKISFWEDSLQSLEGLSQLKASLFLGCFVVGGVCAVASYLLCLWQVRRQRRHRF